MPPQNIASGSNAQARNVKITRVISSAGWSPERRAAERRDIERRYAWITERHRAEARSNPKRLMTKIRMHELERLYHYRYGMTLPEDDDGRDSLELFAHHAAHLGGEVVSHIVAWASLWCPWIDQDEATEIAERIAAAPVKFKVDTLAWRLGLTMAERTALRITTVGAVDCAEDQRKERRKANDREAARRRRAAKRTGNPRGRPRKNASAAGSISIADDAFSAWMVTELAARRAHEGRAPLPPYLAILSDDLARCAAILRPRLYGSHMRGNTMLRYGTG